MSKSTTTPLFEALYIKDLSGIQKELSSGSSVNAVDKDGWTPLFYAARDGDATIAEELLSHGADVNRKDHDQRTPLHIAAQSYNVEIGKLLLAYGALVDAQDVHGNTPLSRATFESRGRGEFIQLLVRSGADRNLKNWHGVSPLELAQTISNYDVRSLLESYLD